jgi:hypothetical protein
MIPPDRQKMGRLAFIQLLHHQAVSQSQQPGRLSAGSVLTFHDVAELFLMLAAEHLKAGAVSREKDLTQYWPLVRSRRGFEGVELSGLHAVARLISVRNDLKHLGRWPTADEIADARSGVTSLLEDNTPKIFALEFAAIDMADVVPQDEVRERLKTAADAEAAGDRTEAMAQLAEAFRDIFRPFSGAHSAHRSYGFGPTISDHSGFAIGVESAMTALAGSIAGQHRRHVGATGRDVDKRIADLTNAVAAMQRGTRVLALGIDYGAYDRFRRLTPRISSSGEHRRVQPPPGYAPTHDEYDYCVQFLIEASLRIAEVEANSVAASWHARWPG